MELSPLIQNSVQQDYFPELYPMYLPSSQICSLLWCCFVAPSKCGLPPSPELLWEILEMEENPTQQPNIYLFPPSRKSPLIEICLPLSKVSFLSHHIAFSINHPMQASFVAVVISVASFFNFRLDPILIYRCLLNVFFSMTKALNGQSSPKQNSHSVHFSILFGKPCIS